jgi:hypothetical protein
VFAVSFVVENSAGLILSLDDPISLSIKSGSSEQVRLIFCVNTLKNLGNGCQSLTHIDDCTEGEHFP